MIAQKQPGDFIRPNLDWWRDNSRPGFPLPLYALVIAVDRRYVYVKDPRGFGAKPEPAWLIVLYPGTGKIDEIVDAEHLLVVHR